MGGGSKTTNVTNDTGLDEDQYSQLMASQGNTQQQLTDTSTKASTQMKEGFAGVNTGIAGVNTGIAGVNTGIAGVNTGITDIGQQIGGVNQNVTAQGGAVTDAVNTAAVADANRSAATQGMINTGFAGTGQQISDVSGKVDQVGNSVTSGFGGVNANLQQGFTDTIRDTRNTGQWLNEQTGQGFTNLSDLVTDRFGTAASQLTAAQASIMGGQAGLNDKLAQTGDRLNTFYGGLAAGQAGIQGSVDGVQNGLSDFNAQYDKDSTLAQQTRSDIQTGMMNQTNRIRDEMGKTIGAVQTGQDGLMKMVGGVSRGVAGVGSGLAQVGSEVGDVNSAVSRNGDTISRVNDGVTRVGADMGASMSATEKKLNEGFHSMGNSMLHNRNDLTEGFASLDSTVGRTGSNIQNDIGSTRGDLNAGFTILDNTVGRTGSDIQNDIGSTRGDLTEGFANLGNKVGETGSSIRGDIGNTKDYLTDQISKTGQSIGNTVEATGKNIYQRGEEQTLEVGRRVAQVKDTINQAILNPNVNLGVRRNFEQMSRAFDGTGNLIPSSQEEDGTLVVRAVDRAGNLNLTRYDPTGQMLGKHSLNMNMTANQLTDVMDGDVGFAASPYRRTY